ncbi:SDR family NAD(P)-dependent oxidoreductase [Embleya sp. NPDC001921]
MPGVIIIGAGPGIGGAVARRFAAEGMPIALVARTRASLDTVAASIADHDVPVTRWSADVADESALRAAIDAAIDAMGSPDVVVYNAAIIRSDTPGQLTTLEHGRTWAVNVLGALTAATHTASALAERGGTFIVTGGMPEPKADYVSLSLGKVGLRALVTMLDQTYGPDGVHVAGVTVAGPVAPGTAFDPDDIAEHYWRLHRQPRSAWQREVVHDGRTDERTDTGHRVGGDRAGGTATTPDTDRDAPARVVGDWLDRFRIAFDAHRVGDITELFHPQALFQGIDVEAAFGRDAIGDYYASVVPGTTATPRLLHAHRLDDRTVTALADVDFSPPTGDAVPVRVSIVAHRVPGGWIARHYHAARRVTTGPHPS